MVVVSDPVAAADTISISVERVQSAGLGIGDLYIWGCIAIVAVVLFLLNKRFHFFSKKDGIKKNQDVIQ